jgi:uroporphyrinogen-III decarboxylase
MRLAKKILGDVACIQGNVPSSMMQTASVDRLKAYCEELLEIFAGLTGVLSWLTVATLTRLLMSMSVQ